NERDFGYGRFMLDARSREAVIARIGEVRDPFLRIMLWGALWDAVRETEMKPMDYINLAAKSLPGENDEELAQSLLGRTAHAFERYLSAAQQKEVSPRLESLLFDRMTKASELGTRITYFRAFRNLATTEEARAQLKQILSGKLMLAGVEIKPLDRWQIITRLLAQSDAEAQNLLEAERKRDTSDFGRKQAYLAEAARADSATKHRYFDDYVRNRAVPEDWIDGSLGSFNSWNQAALTLPYLKPALE